MNHSSWLPICLVAALHLGVSALAREPFVKNSEERQRIEQALPSKAVVAPLQPRKLLIFTLNVGYGGHPSIAHANEAFTLMGQKTGAYETSVSADPAVFASESLKQFDAVFFNNTVGNCFTNLEWRRNLLEFVTGGGGLLGVHGTSVAFTRWPGAFEDWPEFGYLVGARGANHQDSDEHVWIKLDDAAHPINRVFQGQGFDYRDEFFRPQGTFSRERVRVLLSIDTAKTDPNTGQIRGNGFRADNDYALAWVRNYGRGRVFYSTIAHNPYVFWDPKMLEFYLAAIQFALGDLPAPTTPSARLTPGVRAQEKLGWRLALEARMFQKLTLFEAIEQTARLGLPSLCGLSSQNVSSKITQPFGPQQNDADLSEIRLKLETAGLRLLTYEIDDVPAGEAEGRALFEFGRKMGIETFIGVPRPQSLVWLDTLCKTYRIQFALDCNSRRGVRWYQNPDSALRLCESSSKWIGVCADPSAWPGLNAERVVQTLNQRLLAVRLGPAQSADQIGPILAEIHRLGLKPALFALTGPGESAAAAPALAQNIDLFNSAALKEATKP